MGGCEMDAVTREQALEAAARAVLYHDERGQGTGYAEAMDALRAALAMPPAQGVDMRSWLAGWEVARDKAANEAAAHGWPYGYVPTVSECEAAAMDSANRVEAEIRALTPPAPEASHDR